MKGGLATKTVIAMVIGVIVIAVALYFLSFADALDPFFFNDKTKLVNYATCSMALCASGVGSAQVDKVGCLEREGGQCVKSCRQVGEEFKVNRETTFDDLEGRDHFCGEQNALEFELDSALPISIRGGEVQRLAKPKWVCDGIGYGDMMIGGSQLFQKEVLKECMIMSEFNSKQESGFHNWFNLHYQAPGKVGRQCFDGFRNVIFAPLMPHSSDAEDNIYPSAVYVGGEVAAECEPSVEGPVHTGAWATLSGENQEGETLPTFSHCSIRTADEEGRKKFKVWSETVVNKPFIKGILGDDVDFNTPIWGFFERVREKAEEHYSTANTCAVSVLTEAGGSLQSSSEQQRLAAAANQWYPSIVNHDGQLYLYFQEGDSFDTDRPASSTIKSVKLVDGRFETLDKAKIVKGNDDRVYIQPAVTVLDGHRYLAYSARVESGSWDIFVDDLETGDTYQLTQGKKEFDSEISYFSPSITSAGGKLYLVAHLESRTFNAQPTREVIFTTGTVTGSRVEWDKAGIISNDDLKGNGDNSFPSIAATAEGLMVSYSFSDTLRLEFGDESHTSIGAVVLRNGGWQDAGTVAVGDVSTDTSGNVFNTNNGYSQLVADGGISVFFDQGDGSLPENPDFRRRILQSTYLGTGQWSEPVTVSDNGALMASAVGFGSGTVMAYSERVADGFDLVIATEGGASLNPQDDEPVSVQEVNVEVRPDKSGYSSGETVVFGGTLEIGGEPASGKEVRLELYQVLDMFGTQLVKGKNAETDGNGQFTWELPMNAETKSTFEITAIYQGKRSTYRFTVG